MRIGVGQAARATEEYLAFASQLGVSGVQLNTPDLPGGATLGAGRPGRPARKGRGLRAASRGHREHTQRASMKMPCSGGRGSDEDIENVAATIRNMGTAGIPILGFNWMPTSVWRTELAPVGRGGAVVSGFDLAVAEDESQADKVLVARRDRRVEDQKDSWSRGALFDIPGPRSDEDMWGAYEYFVNALVPVAEEAGVRLALHPDDPPGPDPGQRGPDLPIGGCAQARRGDLSRPWLRDRTVLGDSVGDGWRGGRARGHKVPGSPAQDRLRPPAGCERARCQSLSNVSLARETTVPPA